MKRRRNGTNPAGSAAPYSSGKEARRRQIAPAGSRTLSGNCTSRIGNEFGQTPSAGTKEASAPDGIGVGRRSRARVTWGVKRRRNGTNPAGSAAPYSSGKEARRR